MSDEFFFDTSILFDNVYSDVDLSNFDIVSLEDNFNTFQDVTEEWNEETENCTLQLGGGGCGSSGNSSCGGSGRRDSQYVSISGGGEVTGREKRKRKQSFENGGRGNESPSFSISSEDDSSEISRNGAFNSDFTRNDSLDAEHKLSEQTKMDSFVQRSKDRGKNPFPTKRFHKSWLEILSRQNSSKFLIHDIYLLGGYGGNRREVYNELAGERYRSEFL